MLHRRDKLVAANRTARHWRGARASRVGGCRQVGQYLAVCRCWSWRILFAVGQLPRQSRSAERGRPNAAKVAPYECGIVPDREPPERFPVSFYLVAMIFIMFDIEIIFLFPFVVIYRAELGAYAVW